MVFPGSGLGIDAPASQPGSDELDAVLVKSLEFSEIVGYRVDPVNASVIKIVAEGRKILAVVKFEIAGVVGTDFDKAGIGGVGNGERTNWRFTPAGIVAAVLGNNFILPSTNNIGCEANFPAILIGGVNPVHVAFLDYSVRPTGVFFKGLVVKSGLGKRLGIPIGLTRRQKQTIDSYPLKIGVGAVHAGDGIYIGVERDLEVCCKRVINAEAYFQFFILGDLTIWVRVCVVGNT